MKLIFYEAPPFDRYRENYLNDDEYLEFQKSLLKNPFQGKIMKGCGGFRKTRWSDPKRNKGKRGGLRVIYYYLESQNQIWFYTIYSKDEMDDLTQEQRKVLKTAISAEIDRRR
jgi:hypothetical protein